MLCTSCGLLLTDAEDDDDVSVDVGAAVVAGVNGGSATDGGRDLIKTHAL